MKLQLQPWIWSVGALLLAAPFAQAQVLDHDAEVLELRGWRSATQPPIEPLTPEEIAYVRAVSRAVLQGTEPPPPPAPPGDKVTDPPKPPPPTEMDFEAGAGGLVALSSDVEAAVSPLASLKVGWKLAKSPRAPSAEAQASLLALPGAVEGSGFPTTSEDLASFKSLEFAFLLYQRPVAVVAADLYLELEFATRLPGEPQARTRTARSAGLGVAFRSAGRDYLRLGIYASQYLSEDELYQPVLKIEGQVRLFDQDISTDKRVSVAFLGIGRLGLQYEFGTEGAQRHDHVTVGILALFGKK